MLNTPVIFLIFRRPDLTAQVFDQIRLAKPPKLFVVADGPRNEEERELCEQTRQIIETVDWDCEVYKNYSDVNLGCRERVSSGITWAFEQVEEAIILEDDCLPHPSFFGFCEELLDYYRNDKRIMHISGNNFQDGILRTSYSYYFSKFTHCWGWATWKRAWQYWKFSPEIWQEFKNQNLLDNIVDTDYEKEYWLTIYDNLFLKQNIDTWDYVWGFACKSQTGLSILPNKNLVSNIGFREDATHTTKKSDSANLKTEAISYIKHPPFVHRHKQADIYTFNYHYGGLNFKKSNAMIYRLVSKSKKIIKKLVYISNLLF
jgi:hypothetical protein